ncbi:MAG: penicillin-binding protein 1A [Pseudomonadota bacterium]
MKSLIRPLGLIAALALFGAAGSALVAVGAYVYVVPELPAVDSLREVKLNVPLRLYTRDGRLMAEFGQKRRIPVAYEDIPDHVLNAFIAAEDDRFFDHPGVDYQGILRAAWYLVLTGEMGQGGSTITMQVARGFFLTPEKRFKRKIKEIFLALKIERGLTKEDILTLYVNKIFLGQRAYGVGAAAEVYYGKSLHELTIGEAATIAGVAPAPSAYNPVTDPKKATNRRAYVLRRLRELGYITPAEFTEALTEPVATYVHGPTVELQAPYVAEMVRAEMVNRYGQDAYTGGYKVTTTLDSELQGYATTSIRRALLEYSTRHGYRGPAQSLAWPPAEGDDPATLLDPFPEVGGLQVGVVTDIDDEAGETRVYIKNHGHVDMPMSAMRWAAPYIDDRSKGEPPQRPSDVLKPGDVVYVNNENGDRWTLAQIPEVQGAFVAVDPQDGAVLALVGGFDYYASKYNRAVQSRRQPGSTFKPFVYSAALAKDFTLASIINDAPVVFADPSLEDTWRPQNYTGRWYGPMRLREALVDSRNLVTIRLLDKIGVRYAVDYLQRFGFDPRTLPRNLSLGLGTTSLSPLQLATAYTVFANGGFRTDSYFIQRIEDPVGTVLHEADPLVACAPCEEYLLDPPVDEAEAMENADAVPLRRESALLRAALMAEENAEPDADAEAEEEDAPPRMEDDFALDYPGISIDKLAPRVISPQNAYQVADAMRDVIRRGTAVRAMQLGRSDLSGKTGTTNEHRDAWFSGYNADLVAISWVGFDQERPLGSANGRREQGGVTALPAWMYFMADALEGKPENAMELPPGLVTVRIARDTGLIARAMHSEENTMIEIVEPDKVPELEPLDAQGPQFTLDGEPVPDPDDLF